MGPFEEQERRAFTNEQAKAGHALDLEISDLPPSEHRHYLLIRLKALQQRLQRLFANQGSAPSLPVSTKRRQIRLRVGQALTALGLCAVLVMLLIGNIPSLRDRLASFLQPATPTPAPLFADSTILVYGRSNFFPSGSTGKLFGGVPATCPRASQLQNESQAFGVPVLSVGPFWAMGFAGPSAALIQLVPTSDPATRTATTSAWYAGITLFIPRGYAGNIALRGGNQLTRAALQFSTPGTAKKSAAIILNPLNPSPGQQYTPVNSWESIKLNVFLPVAGCYYLQATWSNTSWQTYFVAGLQN